MPANDKEKKKIIKLLTTAYNAEIETVMNYIANSVNLDGVRAKHIKESLGKDIQEELGHAQQLADRIKIVGGVVPGSQELKWTQDAMQPPSDTTDVVAVIKGVIEAETGAIETYEKLIQATDGVDYVTQDLAITLMADEEDHRREFVGFLKEYEQSAG